MPVGAALAASGEPRSRNPDVAAQSSHETALLMRRQHDHIPRSATRPCDKVKVAGRSRGALPCPEQCPLSLSLRLAVDAPSPGTERPEEATGDVTREAIVTRSHIGGSSSYVRRKQYTACRCQL